MERVFIEGGASGESRLLMDLNTLIKCGFEATMPDIHGVYAEPCPRRQRRMFCNSLKSIDVFVIFFHRTHAWDLHTYPTGGSRDDRPGYVRHTFLISILYIDADRRALE